MTVQPFESPSVPELAPIVRKLLLLSFAGTLGTLARFGLQGWVQSLMGGRFPWGTVAVNLAGCFAFGVCWSFFEERATITGEARIIVLTGFMGAFTTFSTFVFETAQLLRDDQWFLAFANFSLQNFVGLAALFIGLAIGRLL